MDGEVTVVYKVQAEVALTSGHQIANGHNHISNSMFQDSFQRDLHMDVSGGLQI